MNTVLLSDLIKETKLAINSLNYKESVLNRYEIEFRAIQEYFSNYGETIFTTVILEEYLNKVNSNYNQQRISKTKYYRIRRASDKLIQFYNNGVIKWKRLSNLNTEIKQEHDENSGVIIPALFIT